MELERETHVWRVARGARYATARRSSWRARVRGLQTRPTARSSILDRVHRYAIGLTTLELVQGDLTLADTVAIANAANAMLMGGGGVDGAIHRAAGPGLREALHAEKLKLDGGLLPTGRAVITPGFALQARYIIHCVGPIHSREGSRAAELLASCYAQALALCRSQDIESIAFPSISTGAYGYPLGEAADVAVAAVCDELERHQAPRLCRFVLRDETTFGAYRTAADRRLIGAAR